MTSTTRTPGVADLFAPATRSDPYPVLDALRAAAPFHATPKGLQLVTRYADCATILRDEHFGHGYGAGLNTLRPTVDPAEVFGSFLGMDPPDHTRLRRLVATAFTPKMISGLRPRVQELADRAADRLLADGGLDVVGDLAFPLPLTIICEMLGVPSADHPLFLRWSSAIARGQDPDELLSADELAARATAMREFAAYFTEHLAVRRRVPADDLVSRLAAVEADGDQLSERELLDVCVLLLVAGHETTANLISNSLLALLRHPEQAAVLRADPALVPTAVDELVRYDPPVQIGLRVTLADREVSGHRFRRGDAALILFGSAHRDPDAFERPDSLDVQRFAGRPAAGRHIAFGTGIHFCIGAHLARMEAEVIVETLLRRVPGLTATDDELAYRDNVSLRGPRALLVRP